MTEQEKIEWLLLPRFKVVEKHSPFDAKMDELYPIGFIINVADNLEGKIFLTKTILNYPHLFKKLEWWEDREFKDLPKYIRFTKEYMNYKVGEVYPVENWSNQFEVGYIPFRTGTGEYDLHAVPPRFNQLEPATEQQYTAYLKSKKS